MNKVITSLRYSIQPTLFKILAGLLILIVSLLLLPATSFAVNPSISAFESTANVAVGTNDQTAATGATTANVVEVKAVRTLSVATLPVTTETIIVGSCTITFATTTAGSPAEDANCTGGATILTTTGTADDIARTTAQIATALRTLTNVTATGHGALTVSGSGTDVTFTTTSTETSSTTIGFTDGTSGNITSTTNTTGVIPVAQVNTITIGGTVDFNDVFTATLPTVGAVTYTVSSADTTTSHVASGLQTAILASSGYSGQAFTSATSTNTIVITAKVAGTGFTQTSGATNRAGTAQVVQFTPFNLVNGWTPTITINSTDYAYTQPSGATTQSVVESLQVLVDADSAVVCTEDNAIITCTAAVAGTAFTYATSVVQPAESSNNSGSSGGGGGSSARSRAQSTPSSTQQPATTAGATANAETAIERTLEVGATGADVSQIQTWLRGDASIYPEGLVTGYFGPLTLSAVQKFQVKYGIAAEGEVGYGVVGPETEAKMLELFGGASAEGASEAAAADTGAGSSVSFSRSISEGMSGEDVRSLQELLNKDPDTQVAATGVGSSGNETDFFGALTELAVQKFQVKYGIASEGNSGYGVMGPMTTAKLIALYGGN